MQHSTPLSIVILAAGKGTRMKSDRAKVLHELFGAPMVHHVLAAVQPLKPAKAIVIVGHQRQAVTSALAAFDITCLTQHEQLGTGHAVVMAKPAIPEQKGTVMILCGDTPLVRPEMLQQMYAAHLNSGACLTLLTTIIDNPKNYGRILTTDEGTITGIVEEKDASPEEQQIKEINAGIYCVDSTFLFTALEQVGTDNSQGEVYLTDIVEIAVSAGQPVTRHLTPHATDILGVNSRVELAQAQIELQRRRNSEVMLSGVTMLSPETTLVSAESTVGKDSLLAGNVQLLGKTTIGSNAQLDSGVILSNCTVGDGVVIGAYSVLENCTIADNSKLKPYSTAI